MRHMTNTADQCEGPSALVDLPATKNLSMSAIFEEDIQRIDERANERDRDTQRENEENEELEMT
jgi:hypothetical protein